MYTIHDDNIIKIASQYSMCSKERLLLNIKAVEAINTTNVSGSIVEIGVWKGGSMLSMMLANNNDLRDYYLYDTFEGMTLPNEYDYDLNNHSAELLLKNSIYAVYFSS